MNPDALAKAVSAERGILVLEHEPAMHDALHQMLTRIGETAVTVDSLDAIHGRVASASLLLCDLRDPHGAAALVSAVHARDPDLPVILLAQQPEVDDVVGALRVGAFDFLRWPIPDDSILARAVQRAAEARALRLENRRYREALETANADLQRSLALLRADEEAGRRVQQRILPPSVQRFAHCQVEQRVVPSLYLSGDFIDYFESAEGRLAFYLADVSGHGASSAFVTMFLKTVGNRARRREEGEPARGFGPSRLLAMANRELLALGLGKHVAMFVGEIDFVRRELCFSVAGQYPQAIVFDGKCARYLEGRGMPVGLYADAVYEDRMQPLPEGFALALFSDGVMELLAGDSLAEKEACLLALVSGGGITVDALGRALALDVVRDLPDDVAMLFIQELAGPSRPEGAS